MAIPDTPGFLPRDGFDSLLAVLRDRGFDCIGPRVRDAAIVYERIDTAGELPRGVTVETGPGRYRLGNGAGQRYFAWANGPQGIKPWLFRPVQTLWQFRRGTDGRLEFTCDTGEARPLAMIGVRACDLAALALQDEVFMDVEPDPWYSTVRRGLFLVTVHCSHPAATCFCASTGDGPAARDGFDLALDELDEGFVVNAGSDAGRQVLEALDLEPAADQGIAAAEEQTRRAARQQVRRLPGTNLRDRLMEQLEHPRWQDVADRCLACGNCTMVCPSCFCHGERELPSLDGSSTHLREWDSCFTGGHSYIHGITIRSETRHRYRQWLVHKLATWHDQFGRSGCTGCGRCIAWCPVGIDITEEAHALCNG